MTNQTIDFQDPNVIAELESQIDDTKTLDDWNKKNELADSYKEFFYDCSCLSVTSDYDCRVIFDAIERGKK